MPIVTVLLSFAAVAVSVAADQYVKMLVLAYLKPVGQMILLPGFFQLTYVENRGAAFGILADHQWIFITVTSIVCVVLAGTLIWYRSHTGLTRAAVILILSGGIGNLIDRLQYQYVVDYLHFQIFPPVFNLADICVTVGCALMVIYIVFFTDHNGRPQQTRRFAKYAQYNRNRNHRMGG